MAQMLAQDASGDWVAVSADNPLPTTTAGAPLVASSATTTSVASSATVVTLLASNSNRKGAAIFNESTQDLKIKYGSGASSTSYMVIIGPSGFWEMPGWLTYTGIITGLWASANGNARITEL